MVSLLRLQGIHVNGHRQRRKRGLELARTNDNIIEFAARYIGQPSSRAFYFLGEVDRFCERLGLGRHRWNGSESWLQVFRVEFSARVAFGGSSPKSAVPYIAQYVEGVLLRASHRLPVPYDERSAPADRIRS